MGSNTILNRTHVLTREGAVIFKAAEAHAGPSHSPQRHFMSNFCAFYFLATQLNHPQAPVTGSLVQQQRDTAQKVSPCFRNPDARVTNEPPAYGLRAEHTMTGRHSWKMPWASDMLRAKPLGLAKAWPMLLPRKPRWEQRCLSPSQRGKRGPVLLCVPSDTMALGAK